VQPGLLPGRQPELADRGAADRSVCHELSSCWCRRARAWRPVPVRGWLARAHCRGPSRRPARLRAPAHKALTRPLESRDKVRCVEAGRTPLFPQPGTGFGSGAWIGKHGLVACHTLQAWDMV
jgi:hypothetical protein